MDLFKGLLTTAIVYISTFVFLFFGYQNPDDIYYQWYFKIYTFICFASGFAVTFTWVILYSAYDKHPFRIRRIAYRMRDTDKSGSKFKLIEWVLDTAIILVSVFLLHEFFIAAAVCFSSVSSLIRKSLVAGILSKRSVINS